MSGALETGVIYCDDNLARLQVLPSESVDLIYLDPPFFSNRQYEVIWGDEAEMRSFEDRWKGGISYYVDWMRKRVAELGRVLKPTGSLYLHCDPSASHYLKVMLDRRDVLGADAFRNEVTWQRTNTHSDAKRWSPISDRILYYSKSRQPTWNPPYVAHSEEYVADKYRFEDEDGRRYQLDNITSPSPRPNMTYVWRGHEPPPNGWRYSRETMQRLHDEGRIWYPDSKKKRPRLKRYLDEMKGNVVGDVWTDIPPINARARERLGYPTQKPEALLARIIGASSNEGDVVLDPFCGCGTTIAVAERMRRRWIGIDISPTAVRLMKRRMDKIAVDVDVVGLPETEDELRALQHFEFQNWVIDAVLGTHAPRRSGDLGIDGYSFLERLPIQVKQSDKVGREVVDKFETAVRRDGSHKGYIVAFSFSKGAFDEIARARSEGLEIELVTVATLLDNPLEQPPDDNLPDLTRQLLERAREAAAKRAVRQPPPRTATEVATSIGL